MPSGEGAIRDVRIGIGDGQPQRKHNGISCRPRTGDRSAGENEPGRAGAVHVEGVCVDRRARFRAVADRDKSGAETCRQFRAKAQRSGRHVRSARVRVRGRRRIHACARLRKPEIAAQGKGPARENLVCRDVYREHARAGGVRGRVRHRNRSRHLPVKAGNLQRMPLEVD